MSTGRDQTLLSVRGLDAGYGRGPVLRGIDLDVHPSEAVTLLGPNGAGKTTLLRAISGAIRPSRGDIAFGGTSVVGRRPDQMLSLGVAHVLEGRQVFGSMTVGENLKLGACRRRDRGVAADIERLEETFQILATARNRSAAMLSGGEQQMLALARALVSRPRLLLLDEPSLGLAPALLAGLADAIRWARTTFETAVLVVEQHSWLALELAERAYVLVSGEIVMSQPTAVLRDNPDWLHSAYFSGSVQDIEGSPPGELTHHQ